VGIVSTRGEVAELAAFKIEHSLWTITRAGTDLRAFEARKGGVTVRGARLDELAQRIIEAEAAWPS
jgi:hypothetical protein